jgi:Transglutaminase family
MDEGEAPMKTARWILVVALAIVLSGGVVARQTAQMSAERDKVKQGEPITFTVVLDKNPSAQARVISVSLVAEQQNAKGTANAGGSAAAQDQTGKTYQVAITIPFDAIVGTWKVNTVTDQFVGGSKNLEITNSKPIEFEVVRNPDLVLPDAATVQIGK